MTLTHTTPKTLTPATRNLNVAAMMTGLSDSEDHPENTLLAMVLPEDVMGENVAQAGLHARKYATVLRATPEDVLDWLTAAVAPAPFPVAGLGLGMETGSTAAPWVVEALARRVQDAGLVDWVAPWVISRGYYRDVLTGASEAWGALPRTDLGLRFLG